MINSTRFNLLTLFTLFMVMAIDTVASSASNPMLSIQIGHKVSELDDRANLVYKSSDGTHWFVSRDRGVYLDTGDHLTLITQDDGLPSLTVLSIQEDSKGRVYLDTTEGVVRIDELGLKVLKPTERVHPSEGWISDNNSLWFTSGWNRSGPLRYDGSRLHQLTFPKSKLEDDFRARFPNASHNPYGIYSIHEDSMGHLWFGTSEMGVFHFDGKRVRWMHEPHLTTTPAGGTFGIRSIAEDKSGRIWINTARFAYRLNDDDLSEGQTLNYQRDRGIDLPNVESHYFMSIKVDLDGDLWMATYDRGIWHFDGKRVKQYKVQRNGRSITVFSLYLTPDGELWANTHDHGAFRFDGREFVKYQRQ